MKKKLLIVFIAAVMLAGVSGPVHAKPSEYDLIVRHLKTKYRAKKVKIPFMWLARAAVSVARPAGVKSFSVTLFEDLKFSREDLDAEMQSALRDAFGAEWTSVLRVRSRDGQQAYLYMREAGANVKIALVTIEQKQAAVIRATFKPEKLAEFINDPKIFGVSLGDDKNDDRSTEEDSEPTVTEPSN